MKKTVLFFVFVMVFMTSYSQESNYPRFGAGFQSSFPSGGLSVKADLTEKHSAQAVIGLFGPFSSYYGRYLYNFTEKGNDFRYKPYAYGQAGLFSYDYQRFDTNFNSIDDTESVFGFGVGAGLEWYYAPFTEKLKINIELGYGNVNFDFYDFNAFSFGGGIHYFFGS